MTQRLDTARRQRNERSGLTLLEVLVALTIFTIVSVSVLSGLTSGDRLRGRGMRLREATRLAANLTESIRARAQWGDPVEPGDSTYDKRVGSVVYTVERTVHDTTPYPAAGSFLHNREMTIRVRIADQHDTLVSFRLVQGYLK
jgi:prepilin-type N-terminal cleavage/methylation domain-containing protein